MAIGSDDPGYSSFREVVVMRVSHFGNQTSKATARENICARIIADRSPNVDGGPTTETEGC